MDMAKCNIQAVIFKQWTSEGANSGNRECVEELQEVHAIKLRALQVQPDGAGAHRARVIFTLNSRDLRMWSSMISSGRQG
jgi:hypothetical protein